jgi:hypothetical protein
MSRLPDPQVIGALRDMLDDTPAGMAHAFPLADAAHLLLCHTRRVTEAVSFLQAQGYPVGSVAGVGIFRIKDEKERQAAIRPEAHRLVSIAKKLRGLGWRRQAAAVEQLALELTGGASARVQG